MFLAKKLDYEHIETTQRQRNFNKNWTFSLNQKDFENVELPHDWSIYFDFNHHSPAQNEAALLDGGKGVYRKIFTIDKKLKDKKILLYFEGVYMDATIYVNGHYIGHYPNGYMPFYFYIDEYLYDDCPNRLEVHVNHQQPSSRWYSGSGIYRDVSLFVLDKHHFLPHRTHLDYNFQTKTLRFKTETSQKVDRFQIQAYTNQKEHLGTFHFEEKQKEVFLPDIKPWDLKTPHLYTFEITAYRNDKACDHIVIKTGFKEMDWKAESGFFLNGENVPLKGVCLHHDHGALGARSYRGAVKRQLEILKKMGVNAIRTAHTPFDKHFLNLCDEMGLLVIEEAFDTWYEGKKKYDYGRFFEQKAKTPFSKDETWAQWDLQEMVRKSYHHPSIIMWSVGNEIGESNDGSDKAVQTVSNLVKWVKEIDTKRYVTMGQDVYRWAAEGGHEKISEQLDVVGLNYAEDNFEAIRKKHPNWKLYGSETSSATRSRGVFSHPDSKLKHDNRTERSFQQSDYGSDCVHWGKTAFTSWEFDKNHPDYAGQFIWTGFDYLGEPTPWHNQNDTPAKNSYFGIVDTAGFPKSDYYFYQSKWSQEAMLHLIPHWTWDENKIKDFLQSDDGKIPVRIYTNCHHAELFLNNRSLGKKSYEKPHYLTLNGKGYFEWRVQYEPGTLHAKAWNDPEHVLDTSITTASTAHKISLDAKQYDQLHYIEVSAQDRNGHFHPWADHIIDFKLEGDGEIVGVDNGNPSSLERYQKGHDGRWTRKLFSGKALVIVKTKENAQYFKLTAQNPKLQKATYVWGQKPNIKDFTIHVPSSPISPFKPLQFDITTKNQSIPFENIVWLSKPKGLCIQNNHLFFEKPGTYQLKAQLYGQNSNTVTIAVDDDFSKDIVYERIKLYRVNDQILQKPQTIFSLCDQTILREEPFKKETIQPIYENLQIESFPKLNFKTNLRHRPKLPQEISVKLSDGQNLQTNVQWDAISNEDLSEVQTIQLKGQLLEIKTHVTATIQISEQYQLGVNFAKMWTGSILPMPFASHTLKGEISYLNDVSYQNEWETENGFAGILFGEKGDLSKKYVNNIKIFGKQIPKDITFYHYQGPKPSLFKDSSHIKEEDHPFNNSNFWIPLHIKKQKIEENACHFFFDGFETYAIKMESKDHLILNEVELYEAIAI